MERGRRQSSHIDRAMPSWRAMPINSRFETQEMELVRAQVDQRSLLLLKTQTRPTVYCGTPGGPSNVVGIIIDLVGRAAPPTPSRVTTLV